MKKKDENTTLLIVAVGIAAYFLLNKSKRPIIEAGPISDPTWNAQSDQSEYLDLWKQGLVTDHAGNVLNNGDMQRFDYFQEIRGEAVNGMRKRIKGIPAIAG